MKTNLLGRIAAAAVLSVAFAMPAKATIVSGGVNNLAVTDAYDLGGTFVKTAPGAPFNLHSTPGDTVGADNHNSPNLWGFDEDQNIVLSSPLTVDLLASTGTSGTLASGTTVASHYIFFDPEGNLRINGYVTFDSAIVAISFNTANLNASDFLANTGVTYLSPSLRGLEAGADTVWISGTHQISLDFSAISPGDYIRVFTQYSPGAVPLPGTLALLGLGLIGLGLSRKVLQRLI